MERNVGLFNESFPPVMDGVAVCVENYAHWIQEKVGGVSVVTPRKLNANYGQYPYEVLDYASVPVPFRHPYVTGIAQIDPLLRAKLYRRRFNIVLITPDAPQNLNLENPSGQLVEYKGKEVTVEL